MANFDTIKTAIDANINTNGKQEITGAKMNSILHQMVDAIGEQLTANNNIPFDAFILREQIYSEGDKIYAHYANGDSTKFLKIGNAIRGRMFFGGSINPRFCLKFFDSNKAYISTYTGSVAGIQDFSLSKSDLPSNAVYFIATNYNAYRKEAYLISENVYEIADNIDNMENDILSIQDELQLFSDRISVIDGYIGFQTMTSVKNRIALWIDDVPNKSEYRLKVSSPDSALSNFNIYKAASDHSGLEILYKDASFDVWYTIQKDEDKPVLYIFNARVEDTTIDAKNYLFEFKQVGTLVEDVESLKKQSNMNSWNGSTVVCFGDSLTENLDFDNGKSYVDYIKDMTGAKVYNIGIGGTNLRQRATPLSAPTSYKDAYAALDIVNMVKASCEQNFTKQIAAAKFLTTDQGDNNEGIVARMQTIDWSQVDIVTIFAGTNDWNNSNSTSFGEETSTDINTTFGAIKEIIRLLMTTYPHIRIYWFSPVVRWLTNDSGVRTDATWSDALKKFGYTLQEFSEAILSVVKTFHLPVCDLYNTLGWNKYNFSQFFSASDGTHPRVGEGTLQIAKKMIAFINANRTF